MLAVVVVVQVAEARWLQEVLVAADKVEQIHQELLVELLELLTQAAVVVVLETLP